MSRNTALTPLKVEATYYWPETEEHGSPKSQESKQGKPWVLVNSTPATCSQLGLAHCFKDRKPIDLVVSGPNYGRNTTAIFALSSGTLGAALEAAVCGAKAIAISFAFFDRLNDPKIVAQSCRQGVRVIEYLAKQQWDAGRVYTVNVPVKDGVEKQPVVWTEMLQNQWSSSSCFDETAGVVEDADAEETKLRKQESKGGENPSQGQTDTQEDSKWEPRHYKWAPKFKDVYESVERAGPGNDGWAVQQGQTSVTALKANFSHVPGYKGEIKL
jgi:tubulin--tyrosine ligase